MSLFHALAALFTLCAVAAYLNYRLLRLPPTIGMMLAALALSCALLLLREAAWVEVGQFQRAVASLDFGELVLHGMLAFLLFAGALHVDLAELRNEAWAVGLLATAGVVISSAITGTLFWFAARALGFDISLLHALLFGALIAPTDPIAVLAILRQAGVPKPLEIRITGESLFNDGIGVVVFLTLLEIASSDAAPSATRAAVFLMREAGGGLALGAVLGFLAYRLLRTVDDYPVEILITLAVATGGYSLAELLELSAPITVVVAGLVIGNHGRARAMSERTRQHVDSFWELVDYLMNAMLFVLIGLELLALSISWAAGAAAALVLLSIPMVLAARAVGVAVPIALVGGLRNYRRGSMALLVWGGLRGGISIALALSLPAFEHKDLILLATYGVVVFSVLVQGLTLKPLAARMRASA